VEAQRRVRRARRLRLHRGQRPTNLPRRRRRPIRRERAHDQLSRPCFGRYPGRRDQRLGHSQLLHRRADPPRQRQLDSRQPHRRQSRRRRRDAHGRRRQWQPHRHHHGAQQGAAQRISRQRRRARAHARRGLQLGGRQCLPFDRCQPGAVAGHRNPARQRQRRREQPLRRIFRRPANQLGAPQLHRRQHLHQQHVRPLSLRRRQCHRRQHHLRQRRGHRGAAGSRHDDGVDLPQRHLRQ